MTNREVVREVVPRVARLLQEVVPTPIGGELLSYPSSPVARLRRLSEQFKPSTCPRCHAITLHGYTDAGLTQHLNPTPLTPTTELTILTQSDGRTYQMNRNREVIWRDASKIRYYPAGNHPTYAVFAAHHCGQHIADQLTTWCWETPTHTPTSQEPLF